MNKLHFLSDILLTCISHVYLALFQFCESVRSLQPCTSRKAALVETNRTEPLSIPGPEGSIRYSVRTEITVSCYCNKNRYWKHLHSLDNDFNNGTVERSDIYSCSKVNVVKLLTILSTFRFPYFTFLYLRNMGI